MRNSQKQVQINCIIKIILPVKKEMVAVQMISSFQKFSFEGFSILPRL